MAVTHTLTADWSGWAEEFYDKIESSYDYSCDSGDMNLKYEDTNTYTTKRRGMIKFDLSGLSIDPDKITAVRLKIYVSSRSGSPEVRLYKYYYSATNTYRDPESDVNNGYCSTAHKCAGGYYLQKAKTISANGWYEYSGSGSDDPLVSYVKDRISAGADFIAFGLVDATSGTSATVEGYTNSSYKPVLEIDVSETVSYTFTDSEQVNGDSSYSGKVDKSGSSSYVDEISTLKYSYSRKPEMSVTVSATVGRSCASKRSASESISISSAITRKSIAKRKVSTGVTIGMTAKRKAVSKRKLSSSATINVTDFGRTYRAKVQESDSLQVSSSVSKSISMLYGVAISYWEQVTAAVRYVKKFIAQVSQYVDNIANLMAIANIPMTEASTVIGVGTVSSSMSKGGSATQDEILNKVISQARVLVAETVQVAGNVVANISKTISSSVGYVEDITSRINFVRQFAANITQYTDNIIKCIGIANITASEPMAMSGQARADSMVLWDTSIDEIDTYSLYAKANIVQSDDVGIVVSLVISIMGYMHSSTSYLDEIQTRINFVRKFTANISQYLDTLEQIQAVANITVTSTEGIVVSPIVGIDIFKAASTVESEPVFGVVGKAVVTYTETTLVGGRSIVDIVQRAITQVTYLDQIVTSVHYFKEFSASISQYLDSLETIKAVANIGLTDEIQVQTIFDLETKLISVVEYIDTITVQAMVDVELADEVMVKGTAVWSTIFTLVDYVSISLSSIARRVGLVTIALSFVMSTISRVLERAYEAIITTTTTSVDRIDYMDSLAVLDVSSYASISEVGRSSKEVIGAFAITQFDDVMIWKQYEYRFMASATITEQAILKQQPVEVTVESYVGIDIIEERAYRHDKELVIRSIADIGVWAGIPSHQYTEIIATPDYTDIDVIYLNRWLVEGKDYSGIRLGVGITVYRVYEGWIDLLQDVQLVFEKGVSLGSIRGVGNYLTRAVAVRYVSGKESMTVRIGNKTIQLDSGWIGMGTKNVYIGQNKILTLVVNSGSVYVIDHTRQRHYYIGYVGSGSIPANAISISGQGVVTAVFLWGGVLSNNELNILTNNGLPYPDHMVVVQSNRFVDIMTGQEWIMDGVVVEGVEKGYKIVGVIVK